MDCWMKLWVDLTNLIDEIETERLKGVQSPLWQSKYYAELDYLYTQRSIVVQFISPDTWLKYGYVDKYGEYHLRGIRVSKLKGGN